MPAPRHYHQPLIPAHVWPQGPAGLRIGPPSARGESLEWPRWFYRRPTDVERELAIVDSDNQVNIRYARESETYRAPSVSSQDAGLQPLAVPPMAVR